MLAEDDRDFDAIYSRYFPFVWRCLRGLGVIESSLDDAAQDVFVVVHRRLASFLGQSTLRTWLYGIVRNVAANYRRTRQRRTTDHQSAPTAELPSRGPGPVEQAQDAEAARFIQAFLGRLDDKKRDLFILALLEDLPIPEVAATLNVPLNTAYTRLRAVRADFERALRRHGGPHAP
jgi:RNA polymerase sigma-70 factor (ECF subfamily)